jgi:hypothetical protein
MFPFLVGGSVTLASAGPVTHPLIGRTSQLLSTYWSSPAASCWIVFLKHPTLTGQSRKRFAAGKAWKDYIIAPCGSFLPDADADLDAYIRDQASTVYHMVSRVSMSPRCTEWGIIGKVRGAEGIRIVNASWYDLRSHLFIHMFRPILEATVVDTCTVIVH